MILGWLFYIYISNGLLNQFKKYLRIWNPLLLAFAGYKIGNKIVGDKNQLEFTDVNFFKNQMKIKI